MFLIYRYSLTDCYVTNILLPLCFKKIWISRLNICSVERDLNVPVLQVKKGEGQQQHQSSFSLYINPKNLFSLHRRREIWNCSSRKWPQTPDPRGGSAQSGWWSWRSSFGGELSKAAVSRPISGRVWPVPYSGESGQAVHEQPGGQEVRRHEFLLLQDFHQVSITWHRKPNVLQD